MVSRYVVASTDEIKPGARKVVTVAGRKVVVFNREGTYYALLDRCPHQGGSLCEGRLVGVVEAPEPGVYAYSRPGSLLRCPWHGWHFDITTGKSWCEPDKLSTKSYPATVEPGERLVEGPYVAETLPVRVEGTYVVVEG